MHLHMPLLASSVHYLYNALRNFIIISLLLLWCSVRPKEEIEGSRKCIGRQLIKVPPALIYDCIVTAGTGI